MKTNTKPLQLNDNLKEVCLKCFDTFIEESFLYSEKSIVYDILKEAKYFEVTDGEIRESYRKAQKILFDLEKKKEPNRQRFQPISGKRSLTVIYKAKILLLEEYFAKIDAEGKHLKQILK